MSKSNILKQNNGFTLVELSIVLVVIGLVIGAVVAGRDMIKAATIRSQIAQIHSYQEAVRNFINKYQVLPGDLTPNIATQFGFTTRSGAYAHGDGDGILTIGCGTGVFLGCETALVWSDLSYAGMIDGKFTSATDALVTAPVGTVGDYLPAGKISGTYIFARGSATVSGIEINKFLIYGDSSYAAGARSGSAILTPQEAYSIDSKIDDGFPLTGNVYVSSGTAAPAVGVCATTDPGNPYNLTTSAYANSSACSISISF